MKCTTLLVFYLYSFGNAVNQEVAKSLKAQLALKHGETYSTKEVNRTCPVAQILDWEKVDHHLCNNTYIFCMSCIAMRSN